MPKEEGSGLGGAAEPPQAEMSSCWKKWVYWPAWPGLAMNWVLEGPSFRFIEAGKGGEMGLL